MRNALVVLLLAVAAMSGCAGSSSEEDPGPQPPATPGGPALEGLPKVGLRLVADGFNKPLLVTHAGDGSGRLYVVEQVGTVRIMEGGTVRSKPFIDLSPRIGSSGGERGLLGMAFHPEFPTPPTVYFDYTDLSHNTAVVKVSAAPDGLSADASTVSVLLSVEQPFSNHNGGHLEFGPEGYLYIAVGDGGLANDPFGHGQNPVTLLGTILRIDVDVPAGYAIPGDNPFVGSPEADEIWSWGLRNPWRFSFDTKTGDLFIADVGQDAWEEVNHQPANSAGGENYGWATYEGTRNHNPGVPISDHVPPVAEYPNTDDCSITGGYVYRGTSISRLDGVYVFGDFCSGRIWGLDHVDNEWRMSLLIDTDAAISSFGQGPDGEIFVVDYRGSVFQLVPA